MSCSFCVEFCPFDAIKMNHDYELAVYDRNPQLVYDMEELTVPLEYYAALWPTQYEEEQTRRREEAEQKRRQEEEKAAKDSGEGGGQECGGRAGVGYGRGSAETVGGGTAGVGPRAGCPAAGAGGGWRQQR